MAKAFGNYFDRQLAQKQLGKRLVHNGKETLKSWKPLLNTILKSPWNVLCNRVHPNDFCAGCLTQPPNKAFDPLFPIIKNDKLQKYIFIPLDVYQKTGTIKK